MVDIQRIYPEAKTALINWIEQNFHEIDAYVFVCTMVDGAHQTIHHVDSRVQALGILEAAKDKAFKPRPRGVN